jgi:hypothetical protein
LETLKKKAHNSFSRMEGIEIANARIEELKAALETAEIKIALYAVDLEEIQKDVVFWRQHAAELQNRVAQLEKEQEQDYDDEEEEEQDKDENEERKEEGGTAMEQ